MRVVRAGKAPVIFPAGEISYLHLKSLCTIDSAWIPHVSMILWMTRSTVLPMLFRGQKSIHFQLLGLIHPRLRARLLIRELFNKQWSSVEDFCWERCSLQAVAGIWAQRKTDWLHSIQDLLPCESTTQTMDSPTQIATPITLSSKTNCRGIIPKSVDFRSWRSAAGTAAGGNRGFSCWIRKSYSGRWVDAWDWRIARNYLPSRWRRIGEIFDLDAYDASYLHLFLWSKTEWRLVGGYRLGLADRITRTAVVNGLYTHSLFEMSSRFVAELNPAIEMGRSFIHPNFQRQAAPLSLLWRGIGEFIVQHPQYQNLFGPVSISQSYSRTSKNLLLRFLKANYFDHRLSQEVRPRTPYRHPQSIPTRNSLRNTPNDLEEISNLISEIEQDNNGVPVLVRHYLRLGSRFLSFNVDRDFSNALDGLIVVHVPSIPLALA